MLCWLAHWELGLKLTLLWRDQPSSSPCSACNAELEGEGQAIPKLYLIWARRAQLQLINSSNPQKQERIAGISSRSQYDYRSEGSRFKYAIVTLEAQEIRHQRSQSANLNSFRHYLCSDSQFWIVLRGSFPKALLLERSALSLHQACARGAVNAVWALPHFSFLRQPLPIAQEHTGNPPDQKCCWSQLPKQSSIQWKFAHQALRTRAGPILTGSL